MENGQVVGSLCRAELALTGDDCVNIAPDGFRTCGIGSPREQEQSFAKKTMQDSAVTGLAQSMGNVILNKPVADGLVEEDKRLKETLSKYESTIVENSQVIAERSEKIRLGLLVRAFRGKINKMGIRRLPAL